MVDLDRVLAAVFPRQHSLVRLADVIAAGGTRQHAHTRVAAGRWIRVYPGVFRLAGVAVTYQSRVLAEVFAAGPGAAASHMCAARLQGLGFRTAEPEISVPRGRNHRPKGVRVHESTDLDRCAIQLIDGIPTTDPSRTILDVARYIGPVALGRLVEESRRAGKADWQSLIATLVTHARQGRHGVTRLRQVIADGMSDDEVTDTDSELLALTVLRMAGLDPVLHHRVYDDDGVLIAEIDLAFPPKMAGFEVDGDAHLDPIQKAKDEERDHDLRRRGWVIRRSWWTVPVKQPVRFVKIVKTTLAETEPMAAD